MFDKMWESLRRDIGSEEMAGKTRRHYERTYWRMFGEFREARYPHIKDAGGLTLPFFREYRNYYAYDLGRVGGIRAEFIFVKAIMRRLYLLGYCGEELVKKLGEVKKPGFRKKEYPDIPKEEIKRLLGRIRERRPDYYYPITFLARTGRRVAETTMIKKSDVEFNGPRPVRINIRAETTKTRVKAPLMRLNEDLAGLIREAYDYGDSEYLFSNIWGRKCNPDRIGKYLRGKAVKCFGHDVGRMVTPHYFRHRFFTECGKANVPMVDVKAISGIKDTGVLLRHYLHSTVEGQDKVLAATSV